MPTTLPERRATSGRVAMGIFFPRTGGGCPPFVQIRAKKIPPVAAGYY